MIILVLADEIDQALGITIGTLNSCGFETRVIERGEIKSLSEKIVLLRKHPCKKHNGSNGHRRRFASYRSRGYCVIGYAEGAEREIDHLWWRDLFYKLRCVIEAEIPESERLKLFSSMEKLRKKGI